MDEFQDLLTQSGQVLKAKTLNPCVILLVGLGGPTLMKKTMKLESGVFPCHGMAELPRILFGHERGTLRSMRLALIEWLVYKGVQGYTWVYMGIHGYIGVYKGIRGYIGVYKGIEVYTWVYRGI